MLESILVKMRLSLLESNFKELVASNHQDDVCSFYITKSSNRKNYMLECGLETIAKVNSKDEDYYNTLITKAVRFSEEKGFIATYVLDFTSIRMSGGYFSYNKDYNIKKLLTATEKSILRKINKIRTNKKTLIKYTGYILNQTPNFKIN